MSAPQIPMPARVEWQDDPEFSALHIDPLIFGSVVPLQGAWRAHLEIGSVTRIHAEGYPDREAAKLAVLRAIDAELSIVLMAVTTALAAGDAVRERATIALSGPMLPADPWATQTMLLSHNYRGGPL